MSTNENNLSTSQKSEINTQNDEIANSVLTLSQEKMRLAAQNAADVLRTMANDDRLLLLCHLSQHESSVGELEIALGIRQPTLSQQLGVLRKYGLVATRRKGKQIFYRIEDEKVLTLLQTMYTLYCPKD